jgi:hypothetical protein
MINQRAIKELLDRACRNIGMVNDSLVAKENLSKVAMNIAIVSIAMTVYVYLFGEEK